MRIIILISLMFFSPCYCEWFTYDRAIADAQRQDYNVALQRLNASLVDHPDDPSLLYDTGVVSYKSGNYKQAQDYFRRASQAKNSEHSLHKQAYFNLGNACCALQEYRDAIDAYEQALKIDPQDERTQHNLNKARELLAAQKKQQEEQKQEQKQEQQEKDEQQKQDSDSSKQQQEQQGQSQQKQQQDSQEQQSQEQKSDEGQKGSQEQGKQQSDKKQRGQDGQAAEHDEKQQGSEQQKGQQKSEQGSEGGKQQEQGGGREKFDHKQGNQADDAEKQQQGNQGHEQEPKRKPAGTDGSDAQHAGSEQAFNDHDKSPQDQLKQQGPKNQNTQPGSAMQAMQVQQGEKQASLATQGQQTKKIDERLMRIMQEQEGKDAERSKGLIKGMIGKQLVGQDGQHCW